MGGSTPGGAPEPPGSDARAFQVDLHGVVDLLARHLYSGPRVYLRELLQNAVDALTARQALEPGSAATVRLRCEDDGTLEVVDTGIGLTLAEATDLLATIGRSSKRDLTLGTGRQEFLGQFGIGLLSAFMVADEIELVSRSARGGRPIRWRGFSDGRYTLDELPPSAEADALEVGSRVRLRARQDLGHWLAQDTVLALAQEFGGLLPVDVAVEVPLGEGERTWRRVTEPELPWQREHADDEARAEALRRYCERTLGFTPLAHLELDVPITGVTGVAFVLPAAASPTAAGSHRVYLKRMLLGARVDGVLPEWAFFVRCVLDSTALRPTASREALYDDEVLLATRDALGRSVRTWLADVLATPSALRRQFLDAHHLAVRAMALTDDEMLDTAATVLPFETTDGTRTLEEVAQERGQVLYTPTLEEFRRVAPVARAEGLVVVNGGYVYDADLLARLARRRPSWHLRPLSTEDVRQVLTPLDPSDELAWLDAARAADDLLRRYDVEVLLRRFEPADLPAVLLHDREGNHQRDLARTAEVADAWGQVLGSLARPAASRQLVLNGANDLVVRLLSGIPGAVQDAGFESLYVTAVLLSGEPLRSREREAMTRSLTVLLEAGMSQPVQDLRPDAQPAGDPDPDDSDPRRRETRP